MFLRLSPSPRPAQARDSDGSALGAFRVPYKAAREGDEIDRGRVDEMERLRYKSVDEADVAEAIQDGNTE